MAANEAEAAGNKNDELCCYAVFELQPCTGLSVVYLPVIASAIGFRVTPPLVNFVALS